MMSDLCVNSITKTTGVGFDSTAIRSRASEEYAAQAYSPV